MTSPGGKEWSGEAAAATLDQRGCRFDPHAVIVPAGETLTLVNSDGILHNLHTRSTENRPVNKAHPGIVERLSKPDADGRAHVEFGIGSRSAPFRQVRLDLTAPGLLTDRIDAPGPAADRTAGQDIVDLAEDEMLSGWLAMR